MKVVLSILVIFVTITTQCIIENIIISVEINNDNVVVSWTYDSNCPTVMYLITHSIDGTPNRDVPSGPVNNYFELRRQICSTNDVTVTVRTTEGVSQKATKTFDVGQYNAVENLVFAAGRFVWDRPTDTDTCSVTYDVLWENDLGPQETNIDETYFEFDLRPCRNKITVIPVVLGIRGPSASSEVTVIPETVGPVLDLVYSNGRFEWNPPINTLTCTVTYTVVLNNDLGIVTENIQEKYIEFDLRPCKNKITVTPVVLQISGPSTSSEETVIPENLGPVLDIAYSNGRFEWNPPINTLTCTVTYTVVLENDLGIITDNIQETYIAFDLRPCKNEITVTPIVLDISGLPASSEETVIPENLGPVQGLKFSTERDRFEWDRPIETTFCTVSYDVELRNELDVVYSNNIDEKNFQFALNPCTWNRIQVIPVVLGVTGIATKLDHTADPQMVAPVHVSTEPNTSGAVVVWRLVRPVGNECEIRGFVVKLPPLDEIVGEFDVTSETSTVNIYELTKGGTYIYTTWWILDEEVQSIHSSEVTFLAVPLTPPSITIYPVRADGFKISWVQTYDSNFVRGHRVVITPNGPLHFLPEGCPQDNEITLYEINDNNVNEYDFVYGQPSYSYTVELFTIFTVLLERNADETVGTLETDPGILTITPELDFENDVRYDVSVTIYWSVPCDVNGVIETFSYSVIGDMDFGSIENCRIPESSGTVSVVDDVDTYFIRVDDLLPFVKYTVSITTHLRDHSSTSETIFTPPTIYSPP